MFFSLFSRFSLAAAAGESFSFARYCYLFILGYFFLFDSGSTLVVCPFLSLRGGGLVSLPGGISGSGGWLYVRFFLSLLSSLFRGLGGGDEG